MSTAPWTRPDLVPEAVKRYGAEPIFHKVRQKPGKPLLVAKKGTQLIFGLPGNPLACHLCFHRYVAAAVRRMEGKPAQLPNFEGTLTEPVAPKRERTFFVPALAESSGEDRAGWRLHPLPGVSSADMFMPARANCYVEVPPGTA